VGRARLNPDESKGGKRKSKRSARSEIARTHVLSYPKRGKKLTQKRPKLGEEVIGQKKERGKETYIGEAVGEENRENQRIQKVIRKRSGEKGGGLKRRFRKTS